MKTKLRRCPLCGSEVSIDDIAGDYFIFCKNDNCGLEYTTDGTKEKTIQGWNTRYDDWVSVEDRLPEKNGDYECFNSIGSREYCHYYKRNLKFRSWYDGAEITHWKELTASPE